MKRVAQPPSRQREDNPWIIMRTGSSKLKTSRQSLSAQLIDVSPHDLRHRFGYRMAERGPLHRLYIQGTKQDLQRAVETIART